MRIIKLALPLKHDTDIKARKLFQILLEESSDHDEAMMILNSLFTMIHSHHILPSRIKTDFRAASKKA